MPEPSASKPAQGVPLGAAERRARRAAQRTALRRRRRRALAVAAALVVGTLAALGTLAFGGGGQSAGRRRPSPQAGAAKLRILAAQPGQARVIVSGQQSSRQVALTFDDGLCRRCVARTIDVLWRTGAHATLFPNGIYRSSWEPQAARIRAMVARGQVLIGNHTFSHHDARSQAPATFRRDLVANELWIEQTFGVSARPWFRPPYGAYNADTLAAAGDSGYTRFVLWSGTLADSTRQTVPYLLRAARIWGRPGAIILAHGNYPNTSLALPQIISTLQRRHLRLVTLAEMPAVVAGQEGRANSASPAIPVR